MYNERGGNQSKKINILIFFFNLYYKSKLLLGKFTFNTLLSWII